MDDNQAYFEAIGLVNDGEPEQSLEAFDRALEAEPERARIHTNKAVALWQTERVEEALQVANRGCELAPEDPYPLLKRADILDALDRREDALAANERALDLAREGAGDGASAHAHAHTEYYPEALANVGWSLLALEREREAHSTARELVSLSPQEPTHFSLLASTLSALDRWGEAVEAMERALALDPDNEETARRLDLCVEGRDHLLPVVAELEAEITQDSDWEQYHDLGSALFAVGRLDDAEAAFDEAHLRHPDGDRREEAGMLSPREADLRLHLIALALDNEED